MKRLVPTWLLLWLVRRNYRARAAGSIPDRWYWADLELVRRLTFIRRGYKDLE